MTGTIATITAEQVDISHVSGVGDTAGQTLHDFDVDLAVAAMLVHSVASLVRFDDTLPDGVAGCAVIHVRCDDVFAWGVSELEMLPHDEIENAYRAWRRDARWGTAVWCAIRRREMPQGAVEGRIRASGLWDLDDLARRHGLRPNRHEAMARLDADQRHALYAQWADEANQSVIPREGDWWKGWRAYEAANPDWRSPERKAEMADLRRGFLASAGYA